MKSHHWLDHLRDVGFPSVPLESTQSFLIPLDSRVHTGNDFHRRIVAERQSNAGSLDVTLLQIHSRGGRTIWTLGYCSASSKLIVTIN